MPIWKEDKEITSEVNREHAEISEEISGLVDSISFRKNTLWAKDHVFKDDDFVPIENLIEQTRIMKNLVNDFFDIDIKISEEKNVDSFKDRIKALEKVLETISKRFSILNKTGWEKSLNAHNESVVGIIINEKKLSDNLEELVDLGNQLQDLAKIKEGTKISEYAGRLSRYIEIDAEKITDSVNKLHDEKQRYL